MTNFSPEYLNFLLKLKEKAPLQPEEEKILARENQNLAKPKHDKTEVSD
jgi:hypothetical protein